MNKPQTYQSDNLVDYSIDAATMVHVATEDEILPNALENAQDDIAEALGVAQDEEDIDFLQEASDCIRRVQEKHL